MRMSLKLSKSKKKKKLHVRKKGGSGSGHHGHRGRPGKKGGSLPGKGSGSTSANISKYFSKHTTPNRDIEHSVITDEYYEGFESIPIGGTKPGARRKGYVNQRMVVYQSKSNGKYWVRVIGNMTGASGSTWAETKHHSNKNDAIKEAMKKAKYLKPVGSVIQLIYHPPVD